MKILVADDSDIIRGSLIKLLRKIDDGFSIFEARNVIETNNMIIKIKPDVLVLDLKMPGGEGLDVMNTVKEQDYKIKVVVFTNYGNDHYREKSFEAGVDYFIDKSNDLEEFYSIIEELMKHSY